MISYLSVPTSLPIAEIVVGKRLRPVGEVGVQTLLHVIDRYGFTTPVLVRKKKGSLYVLIDGAHRIEAVRRRGTPDIPVVVCSCTDDEARALEASQNIAGAGLNPLDDALFLAEYQETYLRLYPAARQGVAGARARHGFATDILSFADGIAERRGISPRQVQRMAAAGKLLTKAEADLLRASPNKVTHSAIEEIGKIADPEERSAVVRKLATGAARKVSEARKQLAAERGETPEPTVHDAVEEAFLALSSAWKRAPMAAKKRFLLERAAEVWEAQNKGVPLNRWSEAGE